MILPPPYCPFLPSTPYPLLRSPWVQASRPSGSLPRWAQAHLSSHLAVLTGQHRQAGSLTEDQIPARVSPTPPLGFAKTPRAPLTASQYHKGPRTQNPEPVFLALGWKSQPVCPVQSWEQREFGTHPAKVPKCNPATLVSWRMQLCINEPESFSWRETLGSAKRLKEVLSFLLLPWGRAARQSPLIGGCLSPFKNPLEKVLWQLLLTAHFHCSKTY